MFCYNFLFNITISLNKCEIQTLYMVINILYIKYTLSKIVMLVLVILWIVYRSKNGINKNGKNSACQIYCLTQHKFYNLM